MQVFSGMRRCCKGLLPFKNLNEVLCRPRYFCSITGLVQQRGRMKRLMKWFGDAMAHAMGAIDAEEKSHVPPPIGVSPYRDKPVKGLYDY